MYGKSGCGQHIYFPVQVTDSIMHSQVDLTENIEESWCNKVVIVTQQYSFIEYNCVVTGCLNVNSLKTTDKLPISQML